MNPINPSNPTNEGDGYDPEREAESAREEAMRQPENADTTDPDHEPYAHLKPFHFKKGAPSPNPNGRPAGIRTLARRMRQLGALRPGDIGAFENLAGKLGISAEALKSMDMIDLLTVSTLLHAAMGKTAPLNHVHRILGGNIRFTPNNSRNRTPDEYKEDSIRFYEAVIESEDVDLKDKIAARARLDAVLGLLNDTGAMGAQELADAIRSSMSDMDDSVPEAPDDDDEEAESTPDDGENDTVVEV